MQGNSRTITSAQTAPDERLAGTIARHLAHPFQKPIADYNRAAFEAALVGWDGQRPWLLDACCGVGHSTIALAEQFPHHHVVGVDQSLDRLTRGKPQALPANARLIRADLVDFWRLLAAAAIRLDRHYLLYPNPWPKLGDYYRRWHGHAVFPIALQLGGVLECRSNWRIYVEEHAAAVTQITGRPALVEAWQPPRDLTLFEKKYRESGQALWRCVVDLRSPHSAC